jgi:hypothetical protein
MDNILLNKSCSPSRVEEFVFYFCQYLDRSTKYGYRKFFNFFPINFRDDIIEYKSVQEVISDKMLCFQIFRKCFHSVIINQNLHALSKSVPWPVYSHHSRLHSKKLLIFIENNDFFTLHKTFHICIISTRIFNTNTLNVRSSYIRISIEKYI